MLSSLIMMSCINSVVLLFDLGVLYKFRCSLIGLVSYINLCVPFLVLASPVFLRINKCIMHSLQWNTNTSVSCLKILTLKIHMIKSYCQTYNSFWLRDWSLILSQIERTQVEKLLMHIWSWMIISVCTTLLKLL